MLSLVVNTNQNEARPKSSKSIPVHSSLLAVALPFLMSSSFFLGSLSRNFFAWDLYYSCDNEIRLNLFDGKKTPKAVETMCVSSKPTSKRAELSANYFLSCYARNMSEMCRMSAEDYKNETGLIHYPSSSTQQILIDIKNVDANILSDENRLEQAVGDVLNEMHIPSLISFRCSVDNIFTKCMGILPHGGHVVLYASSIENVVLIDLLTASSSHNPLHHATSNIIHKFGAQAIGKWSHKSRAAFRGDHVTSRLRDERRQNIGRNMLGVMDMDMKLKVVSQKTEHSLVEIYDIIDPIYNPRNGSLGAYKRSLQRDGSSYEASHPEFFEPNRQVYINGFFRTDSYGEALYFESLVHPAMMAHVRPQRVLIVGGGEGALLREVLKHRTLRQVTMLERDETFVDTIAKPYLTQWNTCHDVATSARYSCFDDPRARIVHEDAFEWLTARETNSDDLFDVIFVDPVYVNALRNNERFLTLIKDALTAHGIVSVHVGRTEELTPGRNAHALIQNFLDAGMSKVHIYEETHAKFFSPQSMLILCKSSRHRWYQTTAQLDLGLRRRTQTSLLKSFDAATMTHYQHPPKSLERIYCGHATRPYPVRSCEELRGFAPTMEHVDRKDLFHNGVELWSKVNITEGSALAVGVDPVYVPNEITSDHRRANATENASTYSDDVVDFVHRYGVQSTDHAPGMSLVFTNDLLSLGETNVCDDHDLNAGTRKTRTPFGNSGYDPVIDRHLSQYVSGPITFAKRDIEMGEDICIG